MAKSEFDLIQKIAKTVSLPKGQIVRAIGEDCAVFEKNSTAYTVVSTDCLIEHIHFDLQYFSFLELGQKAMAVNLSDIAAMGAVPQFVLVTLGVPKHVTESNILEFYQGLEICLQKHGGHVVGGDLAQSVSDFFINITVIGECLKEHCKMRSTAKVGDGIYVTGRLGSAALGLVSLQAGHAMDSVYTQVLKAPNPLVQAGQMLAQKAEVHAMLDVSDGLLQDLGHILSESQVSAEICVDDIPVLENFATDCQLHKQDSFELRLSGGEDYQLLLTMDKSGYEVVRQELEDVGTQLTCVGKIVAAEASGPTCVVKRRNGEIYHPQNLGFDHFK